MMQRKLYVFALVAALSSVDIGAAGAAKIRPGASPSREQLLVYCRNQIFIKYGQWGRFGKRWLQRDWLVKRVEYCASTGGKSI